MAGWRYSWVAQLGWAPDSWTAPLEVRRADPHQDAGAVTAEQIRVLVARLGDGEPGPVPVFVLDAGYDPIGLTVDLAGIRVAIVVRVRSNRVFYRDPAPRVPGGVGRPRRHGARFGCADPATWSEPDDELTVDDDRYGRVRVQAWHGLHPRLAGRGRWAAAAAPPIVRGTVVRVQVAHLPKPTARAVTTLWLWWAGPGTPDLDTCWRAYIRRFDLEHTFRFCKHTLGWTTPRVRHPEQADRWSWLVLAAYTGLRLARGIVADARLPWERRLPAHRLTPARVRRGFPRLLPVLGSPASAPKPCGRSPGRPKGSRTGPAPRHPAIKKAA